MPGTRKLGKPTDQRMAMLRQQVTDLLDKGRMETTVTRAKEIAPMAEKMISLGKKKDLAAYRQALSFITREDVAKKTFDELSVKYADRNGGYTRITRIGPQGISSYRRWQSSSSSEKIKRKSTANGGAFLLADIHIRNQSSSMYSKTSSMRQCSRAHI